MRKILIAVLTGLCLVGCGTPKTEPTMYIVSGHYYAVGEVVTEDSNVWDYSQDTISDNQPVYVLFYDAGTPDCIYDDEIVGLVPQS